MDLEKVAKMLKYMHYQMACDVAFAIFMLTWFVARHILYMAVVWSAYRDTKDTMPFACYDEHGSTVEQPLETLNSYRQIIQPFLDPHGISCFSRKVKWTFLTMLLALQVITLIWFGMIVRVAWRILNGGTAEDSRSDVDDEEGIEQMETMRIEKGALELDMDLEIATTTTINQKTTTAHQSSNRHHHHHNLIPFEQEVGVERIDLRPKIRGGSGNSTSLRSLNRKVSSATTGVTLPGHHSDRKELLGRIGCDKTT